MPDFDDTHVVVPLYNEAAVIADVIADLHTIFPHVVCIDDGSTDASIQAAEGAGAMVIRHATNLGQGAALRSEEHTSELQSRGHLVCRLLLEKTKILHHSRELH